MTHYSLVTEDKIIVKLPYFKMFYLLSTNGREYKN